MANIWIFRLSERNSKRVTYDPYVCSRSRRINQNFSCIVLFNNSLCWFKALLCQCKTPTNSSLTIDEAYLNYVKPNKPAFKVLLKSISVMSELCITCSTSKIG